MDNWLDMKNYLIMANALQFSSGNFKPLTSNRRTMKIMKDVDAMATFANILNSWGVIYPSVVTQPIKESNNKE